MEYQVVELVVPFFAVYFENLAKPLFYSILNCKLNRYLDKAFTYICWFNSRKKYLIISFHRKYVVLSLTCPPAEEFQINDAELMVMIKWFRSVLHSSIKWFPWNSCSIPNWQRIRTSRENPKYAVVGSSSGHHRPGETESHSTCLQFVFLSDFSKERVIAQHFINS